MNILVLDQNWHSVSVLDTFESLIWTERYFGCGDFELCVDTNNTILDHLQPDFYVWMQDAEQVMIIEELQIESDAENGDRLIVSGRSLESILERRIVWNQTVLTGSLQDAIRKLLEENAIRPTDGNRTIPNLIFEQSDDPAITALTVDTQVTGDNLYSVIQTLCETNNLGFRISLTDSNQLLFRLYFGKDRSYDQFDNPYVVFSPRFDNLLGADYVRSTRNLKTVTRVAGEGYGTDRRQVSVAVPSGAGVGLERREMYTDARDISSQVEDRVLTEAEYNAQLTQRGTEKLTENIVTETFEGQADATGVFQYGKDFFKGDIVQIINGYGMESKSRVTEFTRSISTNGIEDYPTFVTVDKKEGTQ